MKNVEMKQTEEKEPADEKEPRDGCETITIIKG